MVLSLLRAELHANWVGRLAGAHRQTPSGSPGSPTQAVCMSGVSRGWMKRGQQA